MEFVHVIRRVCFGGHCYSGWPDRRIHTGSRRSIREMNAEDKVFAFTFALVSFVIVANLMGLI